MSLKFVLLVGACCVLAIGCDAAKVDELTKQVEQLRQENAKLKEQLQASQQKVAQADEIRKGYERTRVIFQEQLSGMKDVLGGAGADPLPPFEELKNSDWVGKLMPGAAANLGNLKELKEIESELLKSIGGQPKSQPSPATPKSRKN